MKSFGFARTRVVGLAALAVALLPAASCGNPFSPSQNTNLPFSYTDVTVGTGPEVVVYSTVIIDYAGYLYDASKTNNQGLLIDSSLSTQPLYVTVGAGQVIPGMELGLLGMKLGGFRRLIIPPDLAYGAAGRYPVPKNATLVFDISLLGVSVPQTTTSSTSSH